MSRLMPCLAVFFVLLGCSKQPEGFYEDPEISEAEAGTSDKEPAASLRNSVGAEFRLIPAGEFVMGSDNAEYDERPPHRVRITKPFYLQTTEVTQAQWQAVMGTSPWEGKAYVQEGPDCPATYVSWDDATEFCRRLSEREGKQYRLPTEAEWEYTCRAGTTTMYSFGDDPSQLGQYAWYRENAWDVGEPYPHEVGRKRPNDFGLYDIHGSVLEWCEDYYEEDFYAGSPQGDPVNRTSSGYRVLRGGSFSDRPPNVRSAYRSRNQPSYRSPNVGLRAARTYP